MNFEIVILVALAACALALPIPDEEVSTLPKSADLPEEGVTPVLDLAKTDSSVITMEEGTGAVAGNVPVENEPKAATDSEPVKPTEGNTETTSTSEDDIKEVPKSLPVLARGETEPMVPPFAGVRAEPKEGVEIAEAKSTASSPDADDQMETKSESKSTGEVVAPSTEVSASGNTEKKDETPATEEKPKTEGEENKASAEKPAVTGVNKTEDSVPATTETKKSDKTNTKSKTPELSKDKHDHSAEGNKSEESGESKESEESDESNKSK